MGISFNNLVAKTRTFTVPTEGGDMSITYNPSRLSAAFMQEIQSKLQDDDPYAMAEMFCHIVTGWDVLGPLNEEGHNDFVPEGQVIPLEKRYVAWIPGPILQDIIAKVGEDAAPKSPRSNSR